MSGRKLTPVQIADVIDGEGYKMQVRDIFISERQKQITFVYALSPGDGPNRQLGTISEVEELNAEQLRRRIVARFTPGFQRRR